MKNTRNYTMRKSLFGDYVIEFIQADGSTKVHKIFKTEKGAAKWLSRQSSDAKL